MKKTGCRNDFRRHISISRIFHVVRRTLCYVCGRKNQISELGLKSIHEVPNNEEPVCIVQEVGYILPFKDKKAVDPLSLSLMLSDADMEDPRVENCLNEMLEELIW